MWKRLVESNKLWWGIYGVWILILVLANVTDLTAPKVAGIVIAVVLGVLTWFKYCKSTERPEPPAGE